MAAPVRTFLGLSVADALQMDPLRRARIVAGQGGIYRVIRHVNVMEVPDILRWVKDGEFLLTTGFSIKDDPDAQRRLVPELAGRNLAGLAIKPHRYMEEIPDFMRQAADELNFPLVELPQECSFADVISPLMSELLNRQVKVLQQSEEAHQVLTQVVLAGGGLVGLAQTLAELVGNPVLVENRVAGRLDYAPAAAGDPLLDELLGDGLLGSLGETADCGIRQFATRVRGESVVRYSLPIVASGTDYGQISVWECRRPLTGLDQVTLERAGTVAALEIISQRSVSEVARRYRNEFLEDLLTDSIAEEEAVLSRGLMMGWDLTHSFGVLVVEPVGLLEEGRSADAHVQLKLRMVSLIRAAIASARVPIIGEKGRQIVLLVETGGREARELKKYLGNLAREVHQALAQSLPDSLKLLVGIGRFYPGLKGIALGYREAVRALTIGKSLRGHEPVLDFEDLGVYRLLCFVEPEQELRDFLADTIGPLLIYDREKNSNLVATLETYFECGGNLKRMSERLYTHYNTVVYRLDRIEEISGGDLDDERHRLNLELGLKIRRVLPFYEQELMNRLFVRK